MVTPRKTFRYQEITEIFFNTSKKTEYDYLDGWIKKRSYTHTKKKKKKKNSPKLMNPSDLAGNAEEEEEECKKKKSTQLKTFY